MQQQIQQVDERDPDDEHGRRERRGQRPLDNQPALDRRAVSHHDEGEIAAGRESVGEHQQQPQRQVPGKVAPAAGHEPGQRELGGRPQRVHGDRLLFDGAGGGVPGDEHFDGASLHEEHERGAAEQDDEEGRGEREEGQRLGHQRARHGRQDLPQAPLQQAHEIAAEQNGDEDRGADDRHRQQHLEGRLRGELNHHGLPVCRGNERAALEQQLQDQVKGNYSSPGRVRP